MRRNLYRANEGDLELLSSVAQAEIPGRYDESNWGTDWILVRARTPEEALRFCEAYDSQLNSRKIQKPKYLHPISGWITGLHRTH